MTWAAAVTVVVASLVLAACSEEDDQATSRQRQGGAPARTTPARSGEAPTKREFLRNADALCTKAKQRVGAIADGVKVKVAREDAAGVAAELKKALPIADELLDGMRALTPPRGDEAIVGKYLDLIAEQKRRIPPMVEALEAEDISTIDVLVSELREGNKRAERLANDYGFPNCGPAGLPG